MLFGDGGVGVDGCEAWMGWWLFLRWGSFILFLLVFDVFEGFDFDDSIFGGDFFVSGVVFKSLFFVF